MCCFPHSNLITFTPNTDPWSKLVRWGRWPVSLSRTFDLSLSLSMLSPSLVMTSLRSTISLLWATDTWKTNPSWGDTRKKDCKDEEKNSFNGKHNHVLYMGFVRCQIQLKIKCSRCTCANNLIKQKRLHYKQKNKRSEIDFTKMKENNIKLIQSDTIKDLYLLKESIQQQRLCMSKGSPPPPLD